MDDRSAATEIAPTTPSGWATALQWMGLLSLLLLLGSLTTFHAAAPDKANFLDRWLEGSLRRTWDLRLVAWSHGLLYANLGLCGLGLLMTSQVTGRRGRYVRAILVVALATAVELLVQILTH